MSFSLSCLNFNSKCIQLCKEPHSQIQPSKSRLCQNPGAWGRQEMQVSRQGELEVHLFYWHCSLHL